MRGRSVCAVCCELDSPEDPCLCHEGARTCRVDLIYENTTPATKGEEVKRQEFIHQATIALARKRDTATAEGLARFVRLLTAHVDDLAPFDERDPDELPSPDPKLLAAMDHLRNANRVAASELSALKEENAALRQQLDAARRQVGLKRIL